MAGLYSDKPAISTAKEGERGLTKAHFHVLN
jgi:hypothetical protein